MTDRMVTKSSRTNRPRRTRRWLLGLEPIFEGGWLHKGSRAAGWDVENELIAISLFGDVTIDLYGARSVPESIQIDAFPIGRDVDVVLSLGDSVELSGRAEDHRSDIAAQPGATKATGRLVRITAHSGLGSVTVRSGEARQ